MMAEYQYVEHRQADPIKVKLIKGQKEAYGWEVTIQGSIGVDIIAEIQRIDEILRGTYVKVEEPKPEQE